MRQYQLTARQLADATAGILDRLYAVTGYAEDDLLGPEDFVDAGAALLAQADAHAVVLGDTALAAELSAKRGGAVEPLGLQMPDQESRLQLALGTLLARVAEGVPGQVSGPDAVARIATAEPLSAGRWAVQTGMREHKVERWRRATSGSPCPVCADLAHGTVPVTVTMWDHPGCGCSPEPV